MDNAAICINCGRSLAPEAAQSYTPPPASTSYAEASPVGEQIPNYLVQSIVVTLCCCFPLGAVAIIFAAQVNSKLAQGDIAGARDASAKAKMFCWIFFGLGVVTWIVTTVFFGAAIMQGIREASAAS